MVEQQTIKYAPQWNNMPVENNFFKEFWSTAVAFDPFPSTDEPEKRTLKEFLIKFSILNGQKPLTLDFNTFCSSTGLDYNNSKYVNHPTPEAVKKELGNIAINQSYLDKTCPEKLISCGLENSIHFCDSGSRREGPEASGALSKKSKRPKSKKPPTKTKVTPPKPTEGFEQSHSVSSGTVPDPQDLERDIQLASTGLPSTLDEGTRKSKPLPEIITAGSCCIHGCVVIGDMVMIHDFELGPVNDVKTLKLRVSVYSIKFLKAIFGIIEELITKIIVYYLFEDEVEFHRGRSLLLLVIVNTASLHFLLLEFIICIELHGGEMITSQLQGKLWLYDEVRTAKTTPRPEGPLGDKDSGGNIPLADMEPIHTFVVDPSGTAAKYQPDTEPLQLQTFADIQAYMLSDDELDKESDEDEVLTVRDDMDEAIQAAKEEHHEEATVSYADLKASTDQYYDKNITHRDQTDKLVEASMSSLDKSSTTINDPAANKKINEVTETFARISSNITEPSSAPSGSVTPTLALTHIPANVKGENATNTATEEPPSHTEGETGDTTMAILISSIQPIEVQPTHAQQITSIISHPKSSQATPRIDKGKGIAIESDEDPSKKLVPASTIIRPDPDEPVRDKEEKMKKTAEEEKLLAMSRSEVTKVVGETFKKARDAEHEVLKREHSKKVKRLTELNRRRAEEYMWTMTNKIKPKPITDVRIHPNTKPIVASVFRNNDKRNFDVYNPFKFTDFGITELDELGPIIQKKRTPLSKT
ncbi:hypothetical protein Tco_0932358 [Tanacetum coccineum]